MNRLTRAIDMLFHAENSLTEAGTPPVNPSHFRGCQLHVSHCKEELAAATAADTAQVEDTETVTLESILEKQAIEQAAHDLKFTGGRALATFKEMQRNSIIGYTTSAQLAFDCLVNAYINEVHHISSTGGDFLTIDFRDGSLVTIKTGSWVKHGFYCQMQDRRC